MSTPSSMKHVTSDTVDKSSNNSIPTKVGKNKDRCFAQSSNQSGFFQRARAPASGDAACQKPWCPNRCRIKIFQSKRTRQKPTQSPITFSGRVTTQGVHELRHLQSSWSMALSCTFRIHWSTLFGHAALCHTICECVMGNLCASGLSHKRILYINQQSKKTICEKGPLRNPLQSPGYLTCAVTTTAARPRSTAVVGPSVPRHCSSWLVPTLILSFHLAFDGWSHWFVLILICTCHVNQHQTEEYVAG